MGPEVRRIDVNWQAVMAHTDVTAFEKSSEKYPIPPRSDARLATNFNVAARVVSNHFLINMSTIVPYIYQYHVSIYRIDRGGEVDLTNECSVQEDYRINYDILKVLRSAHSDWEGIGWAYDCKSTVHTSAELPLPIVPTEDGLETRSLTERVDMSSSTPFKRSYQIKLTRSAVLDTRTVQDGNEATMRALTAAVHEFARAGQYSDRQKWSLVGSKAFPHVAEPRCEHGTAYFLQRGYYAGLKACLAGLVLVSDMAVACFLSGGPGVNVVWQAAGARDFQDFERELRRNPMSRRQVADVERVLKGAKIRTTHLKDFKKFKGLGPAANSPESSFMYNDKTMTVQEYFEMMAESNPVYRDAMSHGRLRYPHLPTVNIGSKKRQMLVPLELIEVAAGQSLKLAAYTEKLTQETIKKAAVRPAERFQIICDRDDYDGRSFVKHLATDMTAAQFGVSDVSAEPLEVDAYVLPSARLQYKSSVVDAGTQGRWFTPRDGYVDSASDKNGNTDILYGIIATISGSPRNIDRSLEVKVSVCVRTYNIDLILCALMAIIERTGAGREELKTRSASRW